MYNAGEAIERAGNSTSGQLRGGFGQPGQLMYGPSSACSPDFGHRHHPGPEARRGPVGEFRGPAGGYSRPGLLAPSSVRSGQHARRQGSVADRGADGGSRHADRSSGRFHGSYLFSHRDGTSPQSHVGGRNHGHDRVPGHGASPTIWGGRDCLNAGAAYVADEYVSASSVIYNPSALPTYSGVLRKRRARDFAFQNSSEEDDSDADVFAYLEGAEEAGSRLSPTMAGEASVSRGAGGAAASSGLFVTAANGTMRANHGGSFGRCESFGGAASYNSAGIHSQPMQPATTQPAPPGSNLELQNSSFSCSDDGSSLHFSGSPASAYAATNEARVGRPGSSQRGKKQLSWIEVGRCAGWEQVQTEMSKLENQHSDGGMSIDNGSNFSNVWVTYRYHCCYQKAIHCPWRFRVRVYRFTDDGKLDCSVTPVERHKRRWHHAQHDCRVDICTSHQHCDHTGPQRYGPHLMFKNFANRDQAMLGYRRKEISNWLRSRQIEDPSQNQSVLIKKWCERTSKENKALSVGCPPAGKGGVGRARAGSAGSLYTAGHHFSFAQVVCRDDFSEHTPYLVPGSILVSPTPNGPTSSLFTTMHCSLNLIRARMWYGPGGVAGAVDHTFKVCHITHAMQILCLLGIVCRLMHTPNFLCTQMDSYGSPHLVVSVVAPNSSVKRIAFGSVGSTDTVTTEHCFEIVMQHCREVAALYQHCGWEV